MKIFNYPWHLGHQYELQKFKNIEWDWLIQYHRQYNDIPRGDFFKGQWVNSYTEGKYDLALLHLDQQCLEPNIWNRGKGQLYRELNEVIQDIPKAVIMHGTPFYPEMFEDKEELIDLVKRAIGDNYCITNSKKAAEQWGFGNPIWHGMDPDEWWDLPKEPRVVTMIGPAGLDYYYDRTFLRGIKEYLEEEGITHCHITVDYTAKNWDEYRDFIGRSLIYINPTLESPMPRARTEAMLSGCCVLTTPHQDADTFIENGKNGIIIPRNPKAVVDIVKELLNDYDTAIKIGQEGKKTAKKLFNHKRFESDWQKVIKKLC